MKNIISLVCVLILFGCSSDDSNNSLPFFLTSDPIIGEWQFSKEVYHITDGNNVERFADDCELMSRITFNANGTVVVLGYIDEGNGCEIESIDWEYFNWSNNGNGNYIIVSKIQGQQEESSFVHPTFLNNNNTMIISDEGSGVYDGQEFNSSEEYYNKI